LMWGLFILLACFGIDRVMGNHHFGRKLAGDQNGHHGHGHWDGSSDVTDCLAKQQNDTAACGGIGCFKTQCGTDGSFSPKQSWGSTGQCWCVDQLTGNELQGTKNRCTPEFSCDGVSACSVRKQAELVACGGKIGCFVSQCDADGSFSPIQRWGSTGSCWCVDELGVEVNSTRSHGVACSDSMNCDAPQPMRAMGRRLVGRFFLGVGLHVLVAIMILTPALASAYVAVFNAIATNSPIKFKDFFSCFCCRYYCRFVRLAIVLNFAKGILSLLILPGIWWMLATMFAIPLHHQHKFLGVCKAVSVSIKVVHMHFCNILGFIVLLGLIQILGFLCLIVGLLYTAPLAFVAICYCYHDLIGINPVLTAEGLGSSHI